MKLQETPFWKQLAVTRERPQQPKSAGKFFPGGSGWLGLAVDFPSLGVAEINFPRP
jgi:hypothetical protein